MNTFSQWLEITPFSWLAIFCCLLTATMIGMERQLRGKPVGIRTASLIVLGTYVFSTLGSHLASHTGEELRIIGQVITGIGFLGAGVMLAKDGAVVGVTSAATIWVLAAIGLVIAQGFYLPAVLLTFVILSVLAGVDLVEARVKALTRGVHGKYSNWKSKRNAIKRDP